ncbi:MAG: tetratricopeptide repeat protein [Candidatus Rokuibacteriota bacterium]
MRVPARRIIVLVGVAVLGLPASGYPQAPTVTRGLLRGSLPSDAAGGLLRGPVTGNVSTGVLRGPVSPGAGVTSGLLSSGAPPPGGTIGGRGLLVPSAPSGLLLGELPPGTPVGALPAPAPPGARLGDPGPLDVAGFVDTQARLRLGEGDYGDAEAYLRQSVSIRKETLGSDSPGVVQSLEGNATLLRQWDRNVEAGAMEREAQEIRKRQEPVVIPEAGPAPAPIPSP